VKTIRHLPSGQYVDEKGKDVTDLIRAYQSFQKKSRAGATRSKKKANAARENGAMGGRPKKTK
jgi:hypothetical protein